MAKKNAKPEIQLTVLSKHTCPSLSGKSTLKYQLGKDPEDNLWIQVTGNTGGGFFNAEPVKMDSILELLAKQSPNTPTSSLYLGSLFRGSSSNSSGFMLAALKDQGIVVKAEGKARKHYIAADYLEKVEAMGGTAKPKTAAKKTTRKKAPARNRKLLNSAE